MLARGVTAVNRDSGLPATRRAWHDAGQRRGTINRQATEDGGGMATREELVDALAGFTLFGDLSRPQLTSVVHLMEEVMFAEGERVLRQGLTGSGFFIVLDGEASVFVDGTERAKLTRGDFFGRRRSCSASRRSPMSWRFGRCSVSCSRTAARAVPDQQPEGALPDAAGADASPPERPTVPELS
jgi:hypothetical protein